MIPAQYITQWRTVAPWGPDAQVEQDLVITRALVQIYSDKYLADAFGFRGGTALQKLFYKTPTRYSEDIDLVQIRNEPIGKAIDKIRECLDPWLGTPKRSRKEDRVTLIYRFESEIPPVHQMRLKIEVNNGEHFIVLDHKRVPLKCANAWFQGEANVLTYKIEELLGTKMRALFQRKKGRDLYDMVAALKDIRDLDKQKTVDCFLKYIEFENQRITRAQYEENLEKKILDPSFLEDIRPLLAPGAPEFDVRNAKDQFFLAFLTLLPGKPWKGNLS